MIGSLFGDGAIARRDTALGSGFTAGVDCHAVVETNRGHHLGRVYYEGSAQPDTGMPGAAGGQDVLRVLRAPVEGTFYAMRQIGERVAQGDVIGRVGESPVVSHIDGVLRGVLHDGLTIPAGTKIADVDPRGVVEHCLTVSDKAWAVGGGSLEAVLFLQSKRGWAGTPDQSAARQAKQVVQRESSGRSATGASKKMC